MKMENKKREEEEKARKKAEKAEKMPWLPAVEARLALAKAPMEAPMEAPVYPWSCEEGEMDVWEWKGEKYIRDHDNFVWQEVDGGQGIFLGKYNFVKDVIEEDEEPVYDE